MRTDDDENFETVIGHDGKPARVLRDGARSRVSMTVRDSATRLRRRTIHDASVVTDAAGNGGLSLHRPGYRMQLGDAIAFDAKAEALRDYDARIRDEWKAGNNGSGVSVPDNLRQLHSDSRSSVRNQRQIAIDAYESELRHAWRQR